MQLLFTMNATTNTPPHRPDAVVADELEAEAVAVVHPILLSVVVDPHRPSRSVVLIVDRQRPSTPKPVVILFHAIIVCAPPPPSLNASTYSLRSSTIPPEQRRQG
jgi:hypothetical protein